MGDNQNLTLSLDATLLEKARIVAIRRHTSVNKLVRQHLEDLVRADDESAARRKRIKDRMQSPPLAVGERTWTRGDLHAR